MNLRLGPATARNVGNITHPELNFFQLSFALFFFFAHATYFYTANKDLEITNCDALKYNESTRCCSFGRVGGNVDKMLRIIRMEKSGSF